MPTDSNELSERERQILFLVATGASNKEIAKALFISTNTVKVHLRNIFSKIGASSRTEAAMIAVRMGIVSPQVSLEQVDKNESREESHPQIVSISRQDRRIGGDIVNLGSFGVMVAVLILLFAVGMFGWIYWNEGRATAQPSNNPQITEVNPRWREEPEIPTPRSGSAIVAYENKIYVIGGESSQGVTGVVERFDPTTGIWVSLSTKPTPVADVSAAVVAGQIYVPGGRTQAGEPTSLLEIYDPDLDAWRQGVSLPNPLSAYAITAFEGKIYIFGGWDGRQFVDSVYIYDPSQSRWYQGTNMPTARGYASAVTAGGRIYVVGGYNGEDALAVNEVYSPERDDGINTPWETGKPMPVARYGMGMTNIADVIYIFGGEGIDRQGLPPLEYSPQLNRWQELQNPLPFKWTKLGLISIEMRLFALGGDIEGIPTGKNLSYQAIYTISIPLVR